MPNDNMDPKISKKLKEIRLAKSLTQLALSEKAGIIVNYYAKVERGVAIS